MSNLDHVLNGIYCLSQEIASTIINLRTYQGIAENPDSLQLYILFQELHANCLETYKDMRLNLFMDELDFRLGDISAKRAIIEDTYRGFVSTVTLPIDHRLVKKLNVQMKGMLSMLIKLENILAVSKAKNSNKFVIS